jgi:hypothetical protein
MSLLPPSAVLMSKMYFLIKKRYEDDEKECNSVLEKLGPFPIFRLHCVFNSNESVEEIVYTDEDIIQFIEGNEEFSKVNRWECVDTASNMFVRMVARVKDVLHSKKGLVVFYLQYKYPESPGPDSLEPCKLTRGNWTDTFCDRLMLYDDSVDKQIINGK